MFIWKRTGWIVIAAVILTMVISQVSFCQEAEEGAPGEKKKDSKGMTLWQVILAGGWIMIVIGACSIMTMWFVVEYFIKIKDKKIMPDEFVNWAYTSLQDKQYNDLNEYCKKTPGIMSNMVAVMLEKIDKGIGKVQEALAESADRGEAALQRKIGYLSIIATVSPMLGLLGTVLGMIQAFNVIAFEAGLGKPTLLAAGVSKALVTTAAGLIVAIPAMGFYFFFRNRIQVVMEKLEDISTNFLKILGGETIIAVEAAAVQPAADVPQQVKPTPQKGEQK